MHLPDDGPPPADSGWIRYLAAIAVVLVGIQAIVGVAVFRQFNSWDQRGQFGDMFGVVNAFFSGLALSGIVVAIIVQRSELALQRHELELQREELRLQRQEMELTRKELERSAVAQENTERALRRQVYLQVLSGLAMAMDAERRGDNRLAKVRELLENEVKNFPKGWTDPSA